MQRSNCLRNRLGLDMFLIVPYMFYMKTFKITKNITSNDLKIDMRFPSLNNNVNRLKQYELFSEDESVKKMYMEDHAMGSTIPYGASLIVEKTNIAKHNDIVIASVYGELICRRVFISKRKNWLYGDDKSFPFLCFNESDDMFIYGVVTSHFEEHTQLQRA